MQRDVPDIVHRNMNVKPVPRALDQGMSRLAA
jgi:hypothetical protein